eukprot:1875510-Prymnesium_polylepis.2
MGNAPGRYPRRSPLTSALSCRKGSAIGRISSSDLPGLMRFQARTSSGSARSSPKPPTPTPW